MRLSLVVAFFVAMAVGCGKSNVNGQNRKTIVSQNSISDIACGPCAMFNWMSHGGLDLQGVLETLSEDRTSKETVLHLIETYGKRQSATNPSVTRYGTHNGGVGSVNLMLMAKELLGDHLESPPALRGEFLHRQVDETSNEHLERIKHWISGSIDSGVPVLFYLRCYHRTVDKKPEMVFGHHVVITAIDERVAETTSGGRRVGFTFIDSSSGHVDHGYLAIAERKFTAPTFTYRFKDSRALTTETVRTGRPLLEVSILSYEAANPPRTRIVTGHFATFARNGASN